MTTVCYPAKAYHDDGLEWGHMWYLERSSPERNVRYYSNMRMRLFDGTVHESGWREPPQEPGNVSEVLVARRKAGGNRNDGYFFRYFLRDPNVTYDHHSYKTVLDMGFAHRSLFLTEAEAWEEYAQFLRECRARYRDLLAVGERMLAETEAIARMKRLGGSG